MTANESFGGQVKSLRLEVRQPSRPFSILVREVLEEQLNRTKYILQRLRELNNLSKHMSDELTKLRDASQNLEKEEAATEDSKKETATIELREFRLENSIPEVKLNLEDESANAEAALFQSRTVELTPDGLKGEIQTIESLREAVRNERQRAVIQLEDANRKASQYIDTLVSVLKMVNETCHGQEPPSVR
jgi:hypothetical protein